MTEIPGNDDQRDDEPDREVPDRHPDLIEEETGIDPTEEQPSEDPGQLG